MKKMHDNLTDTRVIIDCSKELDCDGEIMAMIINLTILSMAMDKLNDTGTPC